VSSTAAQIAFMAHHAQQAATALLAQYHDGYSTE
jgi:hypothetical protein